MNILITGGSSGLGKQLVKKLSVNYNVDFTYNKSIKSANELTDNLNKTKSFRVNFKKPGDLQNLINDTEGSYYDVLIHNFYEYYQNANKFEKILLILINEYCCL